MNADDRLDRDVRDALEWRAEHRARRAPNLTESSSVVAMRIAPGGRRIEPVVIGRPSSNRSLQFLVVALLLLGVAIAAWVVGAPQLRQSVPFQPVPFGFAGPCDEPADESILYSIYADETPTTLFRDGLLSTSLQGSDGTRIDFFGTQDTLQRRLNERGIRLVEERIAASDISGCRYLRASATSGEIRLSTPDGPAAVLWHPTNGAGQFLRSMTPQEERAATELMASLRSPEAWLPGDAWTDSVERRLTPDQWYVLVEVSPSGYGPGDQVTLSTGEVLNGSDPRYELVVLPGGQEPATFGALLPAAADQPRTRCGVVSTAEARALAESLDSIPLAMHDEEELFTTDLRTKVFVYIASAAPHPPDCGRLGTERQRVAAAPPTTPRATPGPADDFAWVDPCGLLPPSAEELIPGATDRRKGPAALAIGTGAVSCVIERQTADGLIPEPRAALTVYPRSVDAEDAPGLALTILGGSPVEDEIGGRPAWRVGCLGTSDACGSAIAVYDEPFLVITELHGPGYIVDPGATPKPPALDDVRILIGAVLEGLPDPGSRGP